MRWKKDWIYNSAWLPRQHLEFSMVLQAGFENSASVFRAMLIFKMYAEFPKKLADFFLVVCYGV